MNKKMMTTVNSKATVATLKLLGWYYYGNNNINFYLSNKLKTKNSGSPICVKVNKKHGGITLLSCIDPVHKLLGTISLHQLLQIMNRYDNNKIYVVEPISLDKLLY